MTPLLLLVGAFQLAGIGVIVAAALKAPVGYQDSHGFHARPEPQPAQSNAGSP